MPLLIAFALAAAGQTTPTKLPPANPPPPANQRGRSGDGADQCAVRRPRRRDSAIILAAMRPDATATAANEKADGTRSVRRMTAAEFAAGVKPGPERYEERLTDPAIEIDGDIAMVWSPYVFLVDGKVHHCGVDHFDLVREGGRWKVANVTWSSRTTGCAG